MTRSATSAARARSPLAALAATILLAACAGGAGSRAPAGPDTCLDHEDCGGSRICVLGTCSTADPEAPVDVSEINAAQWFQDPSGGCAYDNDCGPWMCFHGVCVPPQEANRPMLSRGTYRYWDTSCLTNSDCGPWICADGWCTQPGFVSPDAESAPVAPVASSGTSCLADNQCPEEADCVFPGYCQADAAEQTMTFVELGAINWYANGDGSCLDDTECGPHACEAGWCVAQDMTDRPRPPRRNFFYYDASCSDDSHCGTWVCRGGWCHDPAYL